MPGVTSNSRDLGTTIQARRLELGLRVEDVAAKSGVSYRTVLRIESGLNPQLDTLRRIAAALDIGADDLLRQAG
jgi:transcriptional regulator with XRE-family HTH domain